MAEKQTIEERIAHFLRLSEDAGATQPERDTAAAQAERLMIKHGIERATLDPSTGLPTKEEVVVESVFVRGSYCYEVMLGGFYVAQALKLDAYFTDYRNMPSDRRGIIVRIVGHKSDADDTVRLYNSLQVQATVAMKQWWKTSDTNTSRHTPREKHVARRDFIEYFFRGAARRLRDERADAEKSVPGSALVLADRSAEVKDKMASLGLRKRADRRQLGYSDGAGAGYAAGKEFTRSSGVSGSSRSAIG